MTSQSASQANHGIGAIFLSLFGTVWLTGWCLHPTNQRPEVLVLIVPVCLAMCTLGVLQFRRNLVAYHAEAKQPAGKRANRVLGIVNGVQWLSIFAAAALLRAIGESKWFVSCVIVIVGLHFIPLASALQHRTYYLAAAALVALGCIYPFLAPTGPQSPIGLLGAGIVLWATAAGLLTGKPQSDA